MHRILELAGPFPADSSDGLTAILAAAAARAAREFRESPASLDALSAGLARMIRDTPLRDAFAAAAGRTVLIEQEFCDRYGRLSRMDRVIVDPDRVTVIDFKTGAEDPGANENQMRGYAGILADVYPGHEVTALLAYVDRGTVTEAL